jgi:hypothetical protein
LSPEKTPKGNPVMGMCNYCNELTRVYEQEDEHRAVFLVCVRCIGDIITRIKIDEKRSQ